MAADKINLTALSGYRHPLKKKTYFRIKVGLLFCYLVKTYISLCGCQVVDTWEPWNNEIKKLWHPKMQKKLNSSHHMKQQRSKPITTFTDHVCICLACCPQAKSGAMLGSRVLTGCWRDWGPTCPRPGWWHVSVKAWLSATSSWPWDARDW